MTFDPERSFHHLAGGWPPLSAHLLHSFADPVWGLKHPALLAGRRTTPAGSPNPVPT